MYANSTSPLWSRNQVAPAFGPASEELERTMQAFSTHAGLVAPLDRVNVDTDQMVPKQFLKALTRDGFGRILFYDWRYLAGEQPNPEFVLNSPRYVGASVLLTRRIQHKFRIRFLA